MSHGLHPTAKATTALRQISFFYFDHASNWTPLSDALCGTSKPPHSSRTAISKLRAELRERQAALPPPKNCINATSKSFSQEKKNSFCASRRPPKARGDLERPPRSLPARARLGSARPGLLPARRGLPAAETPRSSGAAGAGCPRTVSEPLLPGAHRCPTGTGTAGTKPAGARPGPAPLLSRPSAGLRGGTGRRPGRREAGGRGGAAVRGGGLP